MPQLDPATFVSQVFWLFVSFVVLYTGLRFWALPRLQGVIQARESQRAGDLATADSSRKAAEEAKLAYERALAEARGNAQMLIAQASKAMQEKTEKALHDLDKTMAEKTAQAETALQKKREEAIERLQPAAAELAKEVITKLLQEEPDAESVRAALSKVNLKIANG